MIFRYARRNKLLPLRRLMENNSQMVTQSKPLYFTVQQYLERERLATTKSEYHDGVIVAMAGASEAHNTLTFNLNGSLYNLLQDKPCRGYAADMRVRVPECNKYYYPDIVVVCGERRFEDAQVDTLLNPTLIIEVLSRATERIDREEKYDCYRTLPTLSTYVLIAQDKPRIECFLRQADDTWRHDVINRMELALPLAFLNSSLQMSAIYRDIVFPSAPE